MFIFQTLNTVISLLKSTFGSKDAAYSSLFAYCYLMIEYYSF